MALSLDDIKGFVPPYERLGMKVPCHNTKCPDPEHGGSDSVSTSIKNGVVLWHCHNPTCNKSGSIVDAFMLSYDIDETEAIRMLANEYGDGVLDFDRPTADFAKFEIKNKIAPTHVEVPEPTEIMVGQRMYDTLMTRYKGDNNTVSLKIKDASFIDIAPFEMNGKTCAAGVIRWDAPGKKALSQCHYDGKKWVSGSINNLNAAHTPIYKMYEIEQATAETLIIFVEGEKCMRVLQDSLDDHHYNYKETVPQCIVTTSIGGSNSLGKADLSVLVGRGNLVILPDKDDPGTSYAQALKKRLPQARIVSPYPEEAWEGYDAADWIEQGHDTRAIFRAEDAGIEVERDPLEFARVVAAQLSVDEIEGFLREIQKVNPSAIFLDEIYNIVSVNTEVNKGILKETYKEIQKEDKIDWPNMITEHTIKKTLGGKVLFSGDAFWIYTGKYWRKYENEVVKKIIKGNVSTRLPAGKMDYSQCLDRAFKLMKAECSTQEDLLHLLDVPPPIINVNNGELHIQSNGTVIFKDHDSNNGLTYCLDIDYDPSAKCDEYDKAVMDIFQHDKDMIRHWHEVAGYIIQPVRDLKNFFIGYGKRGHNGKSSLFKVVTELIGKKSVAAVKMKKFGESRFDTSMLVGKMLMLDDDLDKGVKLNDGLMKQISEQKLITAEFKGGSHFQFMQYAAPVMLCNHLPSTNDLTKAMITRANIIPFNAYFDPEDPSTDYTLFNRIIANELSGVLNRFLGGLKNLRGRKKWEYPVKSQDVKNTWLEETNNTYLFYKENLKENRDAVIYANDVYDAYTNWASEQGINDRYSVKKTSLKRSFEELDIAIVSASARNGRWKIVGYELVVEED